MPKADQTIVYSAPYWGQLVLLENHEGTKGVVDKDESFALVPTDEEHVTGDEIPVTDPAQVRDVLKKLGVTNIPVGTKIESLGSALISIRNGKLLSSPHLPPGLFDCDAIDRIKKDIYAALSCTKEAQVEFDKPLIDGIYRNASKVGYEACLKAAETSAANGSDVSAEEYTKMARANANDAGIKVEEVRIKETLQTANESAYESWLLDAAVAAYFGNDIMMETYIYNAADRAEKGGFEPDYAWVESIAREGYENGYILESDEAAKEASSCVYKKVKWNRTEIAKSIAEKVGIKYVGTKILFHIF